MTEPERDPQCLFCRIIAGEIPATKILETPTAIAIADINPQAPTHVLVIPRRHISGIAAVTPQDAATLAEIIDAANQVARARGLDQSGYRLVVNQGPDAGQSVPHLHVHVLGGRQLQWPPG